MRKLFLISLILAYYILPAWSQVDISVECQDSWGAGRYNKVTVSVSFGKEKGFARFSQEFPEGFYVVKDKISSGDFSWSDNQLNVVWIRMPEKNPVVFSYYILPDLSLNGNIEVNTKVVIVSNGTKKQNFTIPSRQIMIGGVNGYLPDEMKTRLGAEIVTNVTNSEAEPKPILSAPKEIGGLVYRVQISVSSSRITDAELRKKFNLDKSEKITVVQSGKVYKYQVGNCSDANCAKDLMKKLKTKGIKDPFVVAYKGDVQIKI